MSAHADWPDFDPTNAHHKAIVLRAMAAADAFGLGHLTAAREQLIFNDIRPTTAALNRAVFEWGQQLEEICT